MDKSDLAHQLCSRRSARAAVRSDPWHSEFTLVH
jgi:hypothetical protein